MSLSDSDHLAGERSKMRNAIKLYHVMVGFAPRLTDNAPMLIIQDSHGTQHAIDPLMLSEDDRDQWETFWNWANRTNFRPIQAFWGGKFNYIYNKWIEPPFKEPANPFDERAFKPHKLSVDGYQGECPLNRAPLFTNRR